MPHHPRVLLVLGLLYALRVLLALSPAYIHPDEFFQGAEIAAADILGISGLRTWEFTSTHPVRSATAIHILYGPTFVLLRLLRDYFGMRLTPWRIFAAERLGACAVTFVADWSVWRVVRRAGGRPGGTAVVLASSVGAMAFFSHGFANSAVAAVLAACLDLVDCVGRGSDYTWRRCFVLGGLLAFGGFVHATFPLFALAPALAAISVGVRPALWVVLGGLLTTLFMVLGDSLYFGRLVVAPLNNLWYNADAANLATHGEHPRWTHAAVSMPLVAGALWIVFLWDTWRGRVWRTWTQGVAAIATLAGVAGLSLVRHQEARFVVPAVPAIVLATWPRHRHLSRTFWAIWSVAGMVAIVALALVHQAGVVPATLRIARDSAYPSAHCVPLSNSTNHLCTSTEHPAHPAGPNVTTYVVAWKAFMPPRHLLAQTPGFAAHVVVRDLVGMDAEDAGRALKEMPQVDCSAVDAGSLVVDKGFARTLLLAPASADVEGLGVRLRRVARDAPHVNFDHLAEVLRRPASLAALHTYVVCL